ncbi:MAG: glutamate-1-semialdehyde 2,1-aminomutase [Brevinematales bacterium]|nr:glutamate-1-semialdehyde 2,1-aminomutase [Brevinematales bacterium]
MMKRWAKNNIEAFELANKYIPGGVSSPVRSFYQVGGVPFFVSRAKSSKIYDIEGKEYIDYVMSWGALILGHSNSDVISAVKEQIYYGTTYGAPTEIEYILAKTISECIPSMEMIRFVNSGTEACMSAVRLARAFTGKSKVIKFEGCYHGHADYFLVSAGSGVANLQVPSSRGVTENLIKDTIVLPFNDVEKFLNTVETEDGISCIIVEPIPANMGVVIPKKGFLETLQRVCKEKNILLIFDEVITGFRFGLCGVQDIIGIKPDITCLGKIIGGGFPLACFGGRRDIMKLLAPLGEVYQAGTLSGNPIAVVAGIKTLELLKKLDYRYLESISVDLVEGIRDILSKKFKNSNTKVVINRFRSLFSVFFSQGESVENFSDVRNSDKGLFSKFFHHLLKNGVFIPPSVFETFFISFSHTRKDIQKTLDVVLSLDF